MKQHRQLSFSELEYANKRKRTRRDKFFEELDAIIPWDKLLHALQPYYYCGKRGRAPIGLEIMLRMYRNLCITWHCQTKALTLAPCVRLTVLPWKTFATYCKPIMP